MLIGSTQIGRLRLILRMIGSRNLRRSFRRRALQSYRCRRQRFIYADLRDDGTKLVLWLPFHETRPVFNVPLKQFVDVFAAKWAQSSAWSDRLPSKFLDYHFEDHSADDDPLRLRAEATARDATFTITINLTSAVRKALRRYLGLDHAANEGVLTMDRELPPAENKPSTSSSSEHAECGGVQKADEEYRVGPGRPPKEYRWQRGQSGNPAGVKRKKAKVLPNLKEMLNQALNEPVTLRTGKRAVTTTKAAAGIAQLVTQFAEGDRHARRDLIALAPKLGIDLTAGQAGAIGEAVAALMTASDEAIIADFLRRHGVEPKLTEANGHSISNQNLDAMPPEPDKEN